MKNILITGANSYVGTSFEKWLNQWPNKYHVDTIDMIDGEWRKKSFAGYDAVFHVAGIAHVSADPSKKDLYYKINRDLAIETAQKAKNDSAKQFIFMSSMIIYGADEPVGKEKIITKDTKPAPSDFYGDSKLQADLAIQKLSDDNFIVSIMRPPVIYGPGCKGNFPIIGVGGIMTVEEAKAMLDAGASLVQVYTGMIYNGPLFVRRICRSILADLAKPAQTKPQPTEQPQ